MGHLLLLHSWLQIQNFSGFEEPRRTRRKRLSYVKRTAQHPVLTLLRGTTYRGVLIAKLAIFFELAIEYVAKHKIASEKITVKCYRRPWELSVILLFEVWAGGVHCVGVAEVFASLFGGLCAEGLRRRSFRDGWRGAAVHSSDSEIHRESGTRDNFGPMSLNRRNALVARGL